MAESRRQQERLPRSQHTRFVRGQNIKGFVVCKQRSKALDNWPTICLFTKSLLSPRRSGKRRFYGWPHIRVPQCQDAHSTRMWRSEGSKPAVGAGSAPERRQENVRKLITRNLFFISLQLGRERANKKAKSLTGKARCFASFDSVCRVRLQY